MRTRKVALNSFNYEVFRISFLRGSKMIPRNRFFRRRKTESSQAKSSPSFMSRIAGFFSSLFSCFPKTNSVSPAKEEVSDKYLPSSPCNTSRCSSSSSSMKLQRSFSETDISFELPRHKKAWASSHSLNLLGSSSDLAENGAASNNATTDSIRLNSSPCSCPPSVSSSQPEKTSASASIEKVSVTKTPSECLREEIREPNSIRKLAAPLDSGNDISINDWIDDLLHLPSSPNEVSDSDKAAHMTEGEKINACEDQTTDPGNDSFEDLLWRESFSFSEPLELTVDRSEHKETSVLARLPPRPPRRKARSNFDDKKDAKDTVEILDLSSDSSGVFSTYDSASAMIIEKAIALTVSEHFSQWDTSFTDSQTNDTEAHSENANVESLPDLENVRDYDDSSFEILSDASEGERLAASSAESSCSNDVDSLNDTTADEASENVKEKTTDDALTPQDERDLQDMLEVTPRASPEEAASPVGLQRSYAFTAYNLRDIQEHAQKVSFVEPKSPSPLEMHEEIHKENSYSAWIPFENYKKPKHRESSPVQDESRMMQLQFPERFDVGYFEPGLGAVAVVIDERPNAIAYEIIFDRNFELKHFETQASQMFDKPSSLYTILEEPENEFQANQDEDCDGMNIWQYKDNVKQNLGWSYSNDY